MVGEEVGVAAAVEEEEEVGDDGQHRPQVSAATRVCVCSRT